MTATKHNPKYCRYQEACETYVAAYGPERRSGSDLPSDSSTQCKKFEKHPSTRPLLENTLTFSQSEKELKAQLWGQSGSSGGAFRFAVLHLSPPLTWLQQALCFFFMSFRHSEPNHTQAYSQWGHSTAYNCRGSKTAINRHGRRSPGVSLQFH